LTRLAELERLEEIQEKLVRPKNNLDLYDGVDMDNAAYVYPEMHRVNVPSMLNTDIDLTGFCTPMNKR